MRDISCSLQMFSMSAPESLLSSISFDLSPPTSLLRSSSSTTLCLFSNSSSISRTAWASLSRPAFSAKECSTCRRVALSGGGSTGNTWWKRPFRVSAASMQDNRFVAANTTTPHPSPSPPPATPSISVRKVASNLPSTKKYHKAYRTVRNMSTHTYIHIYIYKYTHTHDHHTSIIGSARRGSPIRNYAVQLIDEEHTWAGLSGKTEGSSHLRLRIAHEGRVDICSRQRNHRQRKLVRLSFHSIQSTTLLHICSSMRTLFVYYYYYYYYYYYNYNY